MVGDRFFPLFSKNFACFFRETLRFPAQNSYFLPEPMEIVQNTLYNKENINGRMFPLNQIDNVIHEVKKVIYGKDNTLLWVMLSMMAQGHILLEDIPGVGKTTMALAFSKTIGMKYSRVQFTPDVLPSDVTGYSIYNKETGAMTYQPGAILCNLFLADELNRATSRTQSALLEAMEEGQVTVDGVSYVVPKPFTVIATQNPTGASGTQRLPDSQVDRFLIRLSIGYPDADAERDMLLSRQGDKPLDSVRQVMSLEQLQQLQRRTSAVYVSAEVAEYIVALVSKTRTSPLLARGGSPRATLAVMSMAKALACAANRDYVIPQDVQSVFCEVMAHRLLLSDTAEAAGQQPGTILKGILQSVPAPHFQKQW